MLVRCLCLLLVLCGANVRAEELFPYAMPWNDNSPNLTNLSSWNDKPAGKHGFVTVRDGHLYVGFKRLRLIGVNIVFGGAFPTHEEADGVAARLARLGVNIARFHHLDSSPAPRGLLQKDMKTIDPAQLEKLDYFIAALKREGIYTNLNLHVGRKYPGFADWGEATPKYWKGVDNFYEPMIAMQKDYARALLTHVNAYTGIRYAEEPAIALVEINNENGLLREWRVGSLNEMSEPYRSALHDKWTQWLRARYRSSEAMAKAWGAREVSPGFEMLDPRINAMPNSAGWNLQIVGQARATTTLAAHGIGELRIIRPGTERWHIQWHQNLLRFKAGEPYTLKLRMRGDKPRKIKLMAMQAHAPWAYLWSTEVQVGTAWRDYRFTFAPTEGDDIARLTIGDLGQQTGSLFVADASLRHGGTLGLEEGESLEQGTIRMSSTGDFLSRTLEGQRDWLRFLWDTELAYWNGMRDFLREELKTRALVIGTQVSFSPGSIQGEMDVVDGHAYWQHPSFPGKPWDPDNWSIGNKPMAGVDGAGTLADLALRRVPSKPFVVTEYNHAAPTDYPGEALPLLAAYAAMQDWDGIFLYSYGAHDGNWNPGRIVNHFDMHADPVKMSSLIAAAALFRRGDVSSSGSPNDKEPSQTLQLDALRRSHRMPSAEAWGVPRNLALVKPVSVGSEAQEVPATPIRSRSGELTWGAEKKATVTIDTERSKGLIGARMREAFSADGVQLELLEARNDSGVLMTTLLEGRSFGAKGRVLITALGGQENTGQRWLDDKQRTSLGRNWGKAPVLVEGIRARVVLPVAAKRVSAWALDERGNRRAPLKVSGDKETLLELGPQYKSLWYEVEVR